MLSIKFLRSKSEDQTKKIAARLSKKLVCGLLCLYGPLGAGKTTFIRGLAEAIGIKCRVSSPTFTYQRVYKGKINLYHFDCYRISKTDFLLMNDMNEALERADGIVAVEWAEKITKFLPKKRTDIYFEYADDKTRKIRISKND